MHILPVTYMAKELFGFIFILFKLMYKIKLRSLRSTGRMLSTPYTCIVFGVALVPALEAILFKCWNDRQIAIVF